MNLTNVYDALAKLLAYPDERYHERVHACRLALAERLAEAADIFERFAARSEGMSVEQLQELYTQTFDLNPICSLELGWQLYGENYSRGEFLVEMRQTLRRLKVPETTELPDHITSALQALGRMRQEEADRFATDFLLPALEKMQQGLSDKDCPYAGVLEAIRAFVLSPYGVALEEVAHG